MTHATFDGTTTMDEVIQAFAPQVKGRTFVITGAGKPSIGSQMVSALAKAAPAHILIASRSLSKVEPVLKSVNEISNGAVKASFVQVDLSDHDSIRRAAPQILEAAPKIHVMINSAGNMALKEYTVDKQGIEMQLSVNHVGHFLLTNLLVPALQAAAVESNVGARVVNLTSGGYLVSPVRFDDYNFSDGKAYDPWSGYGQAKTANILFTFGLSKRLRTQGITATAAHPGYNGDTELGMHLTFEDYNDVELVTRRNTGRDFVWGDPRFKTFDQIASTPLVAALDPGLPERSPAYIQNCQVTEPDSSASSPENIKNLWKLSEKLVGQQFTY